MKKAGVISIFIFMTGLFAGLFFCIGLGSENYGRLSFLLLENLSFSPSFIKSLVASFATNFPLALLMLAAIISKLLCPLPFLLLFYKSFSLGFCSCLIHMTSADNTLLFSLLKFFPQNLFFVPAFVLLAAVTFFISLSGAVKTNRLSHNRMSLKSVIILICVLLLAGCITEAACRLIVL